MKKEIHGLVYETIEPGGFYQCVAVGGITDAHTHLHIPGPRVSRDPDSGVILEVTELPSPIQIPSHYISREREVHGETRSPFIEREYRFNERDTNGQRPAELFSQALATGLIRRVSDEDMEKFYPDAFANRKAKIVWRPENLEKAVPMADLISNAQELRLKERAARDSRTGNERPKLQ